MKRVFTVVLLMMFALIHSMKMQAQTTWDGTTVASGFYSGDGSKESPYLIYTAPQFVFFLNSITNGDTYEGKTIKLMGDISLGNYDPKINGGCFYGEFDGCNHWIKGFMPRSSYSDLANGLYGTLFNEVYGTIHNLAVDGQIGNPIGGGYGNYPYSCMVIAYKLMQSGHIYNCIYKFMGTGTSNGSSTMAFYNYGTIDNCYSRGYYSTVFDYPDAIRFGAICYQNESSGIIRNCGFSFNQGSYQVPFNYTTCNGYYSYPRNNGTIEESEDHNAWVAAHNEYAYSTWSGSYGLSCFDPDVTTSCNVTFIDNLGLCSYPTRTVAKGDAIGELPAPTSGKTFIGWKRDDAFVDAESIISSDCVLFATWQNRILQQPTVRNPTFLVQDATKASFKWYKLDGSKVEFNDWTSTNHQSSSTSSNSIKLDAVQGAKLSFDWGVSSEENYDKLTVAVKLGNTVKFTITKSGIVSGHETYVFDETGEYTLFMSYTKDDSSSSGQDMAWVTEIYMGESDLEVEGSNSSSLNDREPAGNRYFCVATYSDGSNTLVSDTIAFPTYIDTDISSIANTIYLDNFEAHAGNDVTVSVKMKNDIEATGFQFDLYIPEGVSVVQDKDGFCDVTLSTQRTTSAKTNTFDSAIQKDGSLRVLAASTKNFAFSGNDGEVCTVKLKVADDVAVGDYPVVLRNIELTNASGGTWNVEEIKRTMTVVDYTIGDANGDNRVSVGDFSAIASHIMGDTPEGFVAKAADVNGDERISVGDLSAVVSVIMNGDNASQNEAKSKALKASTSTATDVSNLDNVIYASDVNIAPGGDAEIVFNMKNNFGATGFQFDFVLPEGVVVPQDADGIFDASLSEIRTTKQKTNTFECGCIGTNTYRVLVASTRNYEFEGNDGEVVRVHIHADEALVKGAYNLILRNIELTDAHGATYNTDKIVATMNVEDVEDVYEEGYNIKTTPFVMDMDGDYEMSVTMDNKDVVKAIEFDVVIPEGLYIDGEDDEYFVDLGSRVTSSTVSNQFIGVVESNNDGSYHVTAKFKRTTSSYVFTGNSGEALIFPMFADGLAKGLYEIEFKNIILNGELKVAPYKASFIVGNPVLSEDVILYGDYTNGNDVINVVGENAAVTSVHLPNLVLTDGKSFSVSKSLTVDNVLYERSMTNTWGTIMLPYEVKSDETVEYYIPTGVANNVLVLEKQETLPANTPALVAKMSGDKIHSNAANVTVSAEAGSSVHGTVTMYGSYENNKKVTDADAYYIKNNAFVRCNGYFFIDAFRAYFTVSGASAKSIGIPGFEATAIEALLNDDKSDAVNYYDESGRQMNGLKSGINIMRLSNGQVIKVKR